MVLSRSLATELGVKFFTNRWVTIMSIHVKKLYISYALCSLIVLSPVFSFFGFLKPDNENIETWFSNSGALIVTFAVIGQFFLAPYNGLKLIPEMVYVQHADIKEFVRAYGKRTAVIENFLLASIFIGTLIWGYAKYFF
jgi:hypothetical protein